MPDFPVPGCNAMFEEISGESIAPAIALVEQGRGGLSLAVVANEGQEVSLESSGNLEEWTETQRINGRGPSSPVTVSFSPQPNESVRFWRVRAR